MKNLHSTPPYALSKISLKQWQNLYLLIALLIACAVMYKQHGWVNNDSLLYFEQARLLAAGQFEQAFELYSWPLYPGLIALVHQATHLDIHTSAQCLNAFFYVVFVAGFQQLLLDSGAKIRTLHWGHLLLFSTPYMAGDVLGMLLRDEGFWAAYTWGLVFWLRALNHPHWQHAIYFQCCMVIAVLFRIEACAYLLGLPMWMLFYPNRSWLQRFKLWLASNAIAIITTLIVGTALLSGALQLHHLGRLQEVVTQLIQLFSDRIEFINQKAEIISKQGLGEDLDQYGSLTLWCSLILITGLKTLTIAGFPALFVIIFPNQTWWSKLPAATKQLVKAGLSISFIVSLVIILNVFVLSGRYVIASGILLLLLATFAIDDWQIRWPRWGSHVYTLLLALMLINTVWDRGYLDLDRLAVNYVESINTAQKPVFYDTENARFYAHEPFKHRILGRELFKELVNKAQIGQYDYYMITISKDDADLAYEKLAHQTLQAQHYVLINTIYGWHKKSKAMIYSRSNTNNN